MNIAKSTKIENKLLRIKEDWPAFSLMFILVMIFLHNGLFPIGGPQVLSSPYTDTRSYFFPILSFGFDLLSKGTIPLWNPYIFCGTPFIAIIQTAIFYPLNFLYLILPLGSAINWTIFLHLFLSGIFIYYLLKNYDISCFGSIVASIVYTFGASHIMHIFAGHLVVIATMTWIPLMFLSLDRFIRSGEYKYGLLLSFAIALQLLAGYPQYLFYSMLALSFYFLCLIIWLRIDGARWNKIKLKCIAFVLLIILGLVISAIQILPTAEMIKYSTRHNLPYEWISSFSLPPENLITFLIPDFFGDMLKIPYWGKNYLWEMTAYVGIMPLLLALIALFYVRKRVVWFFGILGIVSLILALGKYTPLLKLLYTYIPGFNLFRGNSKFIFLNALSLAALSGFGIDVFLKGLSDLKKHRIKIGVIAISTLIITALVLMVKFFDESWFKEAINRAVYSGDFYSNSRAVLQVGFETIAAVNFRNCAMRTIILLILGVTILLLYTYRKLGKKAFIALIFAIIVSDLFSFGMHYMVTFDSKQLYWNNEVIGFLKKDKTPFRVIAPQMDVNSGMVAKIETLNGNDAMMIKRYSEFINFSQGISPNTHILWINVITVNKLIDLLNAKYLLLPCEGKIDIPSLALVFDNGRKCIYHNLNALPRAFIVHNTKIIKDRDNIFKEMISPEFDPMKYAIIEDKFETDYFLPYKSTNQNSVVKIIKHSPNEVIMETDLNEAGLLILGDIYYPGWKVYVDNKIDKIYRANYVMRAVYLKEGNHTVRFIYDPLSFKVGLIITLLTLLIIFIYFIRRKNI